MIQNMGTIQPRNAFQSTESTFNLNPGERQQGTMKTWGYQILSQALGEIMQSEIFLGLNTQIWSNIRGEDKWKSYWPKGRSNKWATTDLTQIPVFIFNLWDDTTELKQHLIIEHVINLCQQDIYSCRGYYDLTMLSLFLSKRIPLLPSLLTPRQPFSSCSEIALSLFRSQ